jgi:hypothetical protein
MATFSWRAAFSILSLSNSVMALAIQRLRFATPYARSESSMSVNSALLHDILRDDFWKKPRYGYRSIVSSDKVL